jgi:hypothetical protein
MGAGLIMSKVEEAVTVVVVTIAIMVLVVIFVIDFPSEQQLGCAPG